MARVLTNASSFRIALEEPGQIGTLPAAPIWYILEPNNVPRGGAETTKVARRPISLSRQNKKGAVVDLDSAWEAELDLTREHLLYFLPYVMFANYVGPRYYVCTGVTATGYTVAANGDLPANTLIVTSGFTNAANNSPETFKVLTSGSTATEIRPVGGATVESIAGTPFPQNALVEVAGYRGAAGTLQINATGDLISVAGVDFTTLRLNVGQFIGIGGAAGSAFAFNTAAYRGIRRIRSITASTITFDKSTAYGGNSPVSWSGAADAGAGKTIDLYFGRWIRNVAVGHTDFITPSLQVETTLTDLASAGNPMYQYAKGNLINELTLNFNGQDKATMTLGLIGTDTEIPVVAGSRKTNAANARRAVQTAAYNTASDFSRLRLTEADETGGTTDFIDMNIGFGNNISPEKTLNTLGARHMNYGNYDVAGEANVILTEVSVMEAVRNNTTMSGEVGFNNVNGAFIIDLPSATFGNGVPEFTPDESVTLPLGIDAFEDDTFGYTQSVSCFPYLPRS